MKTMQIRTDELTTVAAATTASPTVSPTTSTPRVVGPLLRRGLVAGVVASLATVTAAAMAHAAGVSLEVSGTPTPVLGFGQMTLLAAIIGTILAIAFAKRASRPRHTFVVTTVALTLASIVPDVIVDAAVSTKLVLALTHIVAAAIVIPSLATRLASHRVATESGL